MKSQRILMELPDISDMDVAVVEDGRTGEPESLEITVLIPLEQSGQFFEFLRRLRTG